MEEVAGLLYQAKVASENPTDNLISPFYGMVKFARSEPETVRKMFRNLHADDGGDLKIWQEKMKDGTDNAVALCSNCHRKMHYLEDPADVALLGSKCSDEV